jgi:hypothetical protein
MLRSRKARSRVWRQGRVREDVLIARIHGCIAHHCSGTSKAIVVNALHGNVSDKIHKPTLSKIS